MIFMKKRNKVRVKKYENKLFIQFLLWVMLPIVIMGTVSYHIYTDSVGEKNQMALESYGKHMTVDYDNLFTTIREYYMDMTTEESYRWMIQQKATPYSSILEISEAQNALQGSYNIVKYIEQYHFINVKEGWVLNNAGMFPFEDTKNIDDVNRFIEEQKEIYGTVYWLNREDTHSPYGKVTESKLVDVSGEMLVIKNVDNAGNITSILFIKLNLDEINKIAINYHGMGYDIVVLEKKSVLMQTNNDMTEFIRQQEIIESGIYTADTGTKYSISVNADTANGLIYFVGYDMSINSANAKRFFSATSGILLAFAILFIILRYISRWMSKPFQLLQKKSETQEHHIKELFVSSLIKGDMNGIDKEAYLKKQGIKKWKYYRMIGIVCKAIDINDEKINNFDIFIKNQMPDEILQNIFIVPVYYDQKVYFIIGEDDKLELDNKAALNYKLIKDYVRNNFGYLISTGISRTFLDLAHANRAYYECLEALHDRLKLQNTTSSTISLYDDYEIIHSRGNVYDIIVEKELAKAVKNCEIDASKHLLEFMVKRMEMNEVYGVERTYYIMKIIIGILTIPLETTLTLTDVFKKEHQETVLRVYQIYDTKELLLYLTEEILVPTIQVLRNNYESKASDIVVTVMKMIQESKGNVALEECADVLCYHPNHIARILKQEKGVTFSEIASAEKLRLAKYLLLTTEHPIKEIAEMLHYTNVQNFIRFFKNQEGMPPNKYRMQYHV